MPSTAFCGVCYAAFPDTNTGGCTPVTTPLEGCAAYETADKCGLCKYGYFMSDEKCIANDIEKCYWQFETDYCFACKGLVPEIDGHSCSSVKCNVPNCKSCAIGNTTSQVCVECSNPDERPDILTGICISAKDHLEGCNVNDGVCISCIYGYYQNLDLTSTIVTCSKSTKYNVSENEDSLKFLFEIK